MKRTALASRSRGTGAEAASEAQAPARDDPARIYELPAG